MRLIPAGLALVALISGPSALAAAPLPGAALPAMARLEAGVSTGAVHPREARRLQLLAVRAPERLPAAWADLAADAPRCFTGLARDIQRDLHLYPLGERAELEALLAPPDPAGPYLQSSVYPLRVHYRDDAERPTAQAALAILERSWRIEVEELGFRAPLPDGGFGGADDLDVFILPGSGGAGAVGLEANPRTPWNDWSTYITLDPEDYGGELLAVTLAHEFNHCCQAADDWFETIVALESTAVFVEDRVYDEDNDYYSYLDAFQSLPHKPVDFVGGSWAWYVYAAALFPHFIAERYGDEVIADMWLNSRQRGYRNEPDFIDGLGEALLPFGVTFADVAREFARWRYFIGSRDDGAHFEEGAAMGDANAVHLAGRYTTRTLPRDEVLVTDPPAETASNLYEIEIAPGDEDAALTFTFQGDPSARWAVDLMGIPADGPAEVLLAEGDPSVSGGVVLEGYDRVVVVVVNLGDGVHDPERREWAGLGYDLTLDLTR